MKKEKTDKQFIELTQKEQGELVSMVKYLKALGLTDKDIIKKMAISTQFFKDIVRLGYIDQYKY